MFFKLENFRIKNAFFVYKRLFLNFLLSFRYLPRCVSMILPFKKLLRSFVAFLKKVFRFFVSCQPSTKPVAAPALFRAFRRRSPHRSNDLLKFHQNSATSSCSVFRFFLKQTEMRMLPSNGFAYNFNGPALNGYGQLAINHPTGHSPLDLMETGQAEHATHLMDGNGQHSQLYELHPHQPQATAVGQNGYGQPANLDSNLEISGLSLFKLKSFLQPAKKPMNGSVSMQSMFPGGQETTSPQLLSSPTENGMMVLFLTYYKVTLLKLSLLLISLPLSTSRHPPDQSRIEPQSPFTDRSNYLSFLLQ